MSINKSAMGCAGSVVILNGPPHAGKSTIAHQLQATADAPFYALGIDTLFGRMVPQRISDARNLKELDRGYIRGLHAAVAGMARSGCNMIVDHTILDAE